MTREITIKFSEEVENENMSCSLKDSENFLAKKLSCIFLFNEIFNVKIVESKDIEREEIRYREISVKFWESWVVTDNEKKYLTLEETKLFILSKLKYNFSCSLEIMMAKDVENEIEKLEQKIDKKLEETILLTGKTGTETVRIEIELTEQEKEVFFELRKYDTDNYYWEFEGTRLIISYTEDCE